MNTPRKKIKRTKSKPKIRLKVEEEVLASDLGGSKTKGILVRGDRIITSLHQVPTHAYKGPRMVSETVVSGYEAVLSEAGSRFSNVARYAVAIAAPTQDGRILHDSNLGNGDWKNWNFLRTMNDTLYHRTSLDWKGRGHIFNDGASSTYGIAYKLGPQCFRDSFAAFSVGTGVGGSVMLDGHLVSICEPGNSKRHYNWRRFIFGKGHGSKEEIRLEDVVSLLAVQRLLPKLYNKGLLTDRHPIIKLTPREHNETNDNLWLRRAKMVLKHASDCVRRGRMDDICVIIMALQADCLGEFLGTIMDIHGPHTIAIGGGIIDPDDVYAIFIEWWMELLTEKTKRSIGIPYIRDRVKLVKSPIGNKASAFGAALLSQGLTLAA